MFYKKILFHYNLTNQATTVTKMVIIFLWRICQKDKEECKSGNKKIIICPVKSDVILI